MRAQAASVAQVMLRNPRSGATVSDVLLLLDTGVDITLLPRTAVEQLGVPLLTGQCYELMGFDGSKSSAPEDAEPCECQSSHGSLVRLTLVTLLLVVGLCPEGVARYDRPRPG